MTLHMTSPPPGIYPSSSQANYGGNRQVSPTNASLYVSAEAAEFWVFFFRFWVGFF